MSDDATPAGGTPPTGPPETSKPGKRPARWTPLRIVGLLVVVLLVAGAVWGGFKYYDSQHEVDKAQKALQPFYTPPAQLPAKAGTVIRSEAMDVALNSGTATRVLYTSTNASGDPIAVSGMVFLPKSPAPNAPIVAWAHPTVGQADKCAPSRSTNPLEDTQTWLDAMLARGWVVAATDYAGLGTPGPKTYLIGDQSARDLVNSVRVAKTLSPAPTSNDWLLWSHSQGGQAALWAAALSNQLAPDLSLKGVAAAAPAAELSTIMNLQWNNWVGWVIGPEATESFVAAYPNLDVMGALSKQAKDALDRLDDECTTGAALEGQARERAGQSFFNGNPVNNKAWSTIVTEQTPPPPPAGVPMLLAQGTADQVVLAGPNATLQNSWCQQGVNMATLWLGDVDHLKVANVAGPTVVRWASDRFAGRPQIPDCSFPPPVAPSPPPN